MSLKKAVGFGILMWIIMFAVVSAILPWYGQYTWVKVVVILLSGLLSYVLAGYVHVHDAKICAWIRRELGDPRHFARCPRDVPLQFGGLRCLVFMGRICGHALCAVPSDHQNKTSGRGLRFWIISGSSARTPAKFPTAGRERSCFRLRPRPCSTCSAYAGGAHRDLRTEFPPLCANFRPTTLPLPN